MENKGTTTSEATVVLASLKRSSAYLFVLLSGLLSAIFPSSYGGVLFLSAAVGIMAYVLTVSFKIQFMLIGAAEAYALSVLFGIKPLIALISLAFVPMAIVMAYFVRNRKSLSSTVGAVTAVFIMFTAVMALIFYLTSKNALLQFADNIASNFRKGMYAQFEAVNLQMPKELKLTEDDINNAISTVAMIMPAVGILAFELVAYLSAKALRLMTIIHRADKLFFFGKWPITVPLPTSIIFLISYIITVFSTSGSLVYYVAINFVLIMMPPQVVVGLRAIFGSSGIVRRKNPPSKWRFLVLLICGYFLILNPLMLCIFASFFAVYYNIKFHLTVLMKTIDREDK